MDTAICTVDEDDQVDIFFFKDTINLNKMAIGLSSNIFVQRWMKELSAKTNLTLKSPIPKVVF